MCQVFTACTARYSELLVYSITAVWTFGTPPKNGTFFSQNRIFAESHRSIFGRKWNVPKQFKLLSSVPKPNFGVSICLLSTSFEHYANRKWRTSTCYRLFTKHILHSHCNIELQQFPKIVCYTQCSLWHFLTLMSYFAAEILALLPLPS